MRFKKGAAGSAAAFIAVITLIIIMYILFLPPDIREELLSDGSGSPGNWTPSKPSVDTGEIFSQNVGRIDYISTNEKSYDIPTVRIYSPTAAQLIAMSPAISINNAVFDKEKAVHEMDFALDRSATQNVVLSFVVKEHYGPLMISLNGRQIYSGEPDSANPKPIPLDAGLLTATNTLTFSVPNPGWNFWRSPSYDLENVQITADVTDYERSEAIQHFTLTEAEKNNLQSVKLYFRPVCTISESGLLEISLNRRVIFSSVADCGTKSFATLDNDDVLKGTNELRFATKKGSYLLDNMYVKVTLDKPAYPTYFFELDKDLFLAEEEKARCGDYDNICPAGCSDVRDADCCFKHNGYWCASTTNNFNDRCVYYIAPDDCDLCMTGYYDRSSDPHENCEDKCGDNKDDECPSGCNSPNKYYDRDCCYASNSDNFWCEEVPITGISDKCKPNIRYNECSLCPSGYIDEDGSRPDSCTGDEFVFEDEEFELSSNYDIRFKVRFVNEVDRKRVDININGYKLSIDTNKIEYIKIIDEYVRRGTNSIEIVPREDLDIAEISVEVLKVSE